MIVRSSLPKDARDSLALPPCDDAGNLFGTGAFLHDDDHADLRNSGNKDCILRLASCFT